MIANGSSTPVVCVAATHRMTPAWLAKLFESIAVSKETRLVLVAAGCDQPRRSGCRRSGAYVLLRLIFGEDASELGDPLEQVDVSSLLTEEADARQQLLQAFDEGVPVVLLSAPGLAAPPFWARGIPWDLQPSDQSPVPPEFIGFREVAAGSPLTCVTLRARRSETWSVLARAELATRLHSARANRAQCLWGAGKVVSRELRRLYSMGFHDFYESRRPHHGVEVAPLKKGVSRWVTGGLLLVRLAGRLLRTLMRRLVRSGPRHPRWFLYATPIPGPTEFRRSIDDYLCIKPESLTDVMPPEGHHFMDPFPIHRAGEDWVFFEELRPGTQRGVISAARLTDDCSLEDRQVVLERPYHLSYPFLLEHEGDLYLIPESGEAGRLDAFRCTRFPYQWQHHRTLMQGVSVYDATFLQHGGRWWIFAALEPTRGMGTFHELHLFHADHPLSSDWHPHPENPVIASADRARPGGPIIEDGGSLYRVGQDCTIRYGRTVGMYRIERLDPVRYEEVELARVDTSGVPSLLGFHHLATSQRFLLADAWTRR